MRCSRSAKCKAMIWNTCGSILLLPRMASSLAGIEWGKRKGRVGWEDALWTERMKGLGGSCQSHLQYVYCLGRSVDIDLYS